MSLMLKVAMDAVNLKKGDEVYFDGASYKRWGKGIVIEPPVEGGSETKVHFEKKGELWIPSWKLVRPFVIKQREETIKKFGYY